MGNKMPLKMCAISSLKHQKTSSGSVPQLIQGRPPSSKLRGARSMTICACFADSLVPMGGLSAIKGGLPEGLAVCFCGRHAGDQGSERTDWAGLEPPCSPGTLLFNHSAAKQSDGELHMPLVSLISLSLCLHLCLSYSASLRFRSSLLRLNAPTAHFSS